MVVSYYIYMHNKKRRASSSISILCTLLRFCVFPARVRRSSILPPATHTYPLTAHCFVERERERERREEMASKTEDLSKGILFRETFTVNSRDRDGKKLPTCNVNKEGCDGCKACKVPHFQQYVTTFSRC